MLPGPWGYSYPAWRPGEFKIPPESMIVQSCAGYIRLKLPEEIRPQVRDFWPAERPRYWAPSPREVVPLLSWKSPDGTDHDAVYVSGGKRGVIHTFISGAIYGVEVGVPTRAGGGTIDLVRKHYPVDTYPLLYQRRSLEQPVVAITDSRSRRLLLRDDMKGFVTCGGAGRADDPESDSGTVPSKKKYSLFVNNDLVVEPQGVGSLPPHWFFEKDEYYFGEAPWS